MPDSLVHVGKISAIGPSVLDRDKVVSTAVTFGDGTVSHVAASTHGADGLVAALQDLRNHEMLVYVELRGEDGSISRVLAAETGTVRRLEADAAGDTLVEMEVASSAAVLRRSHADREPFLELLRASIDEQKPIAITVAPITREILDVREAPLARSPGGGAGRAEPPDLKAAADWYKKAAQQGSAEGQYALGICYEEGVGVRRDRKRAVELFRAAADQGDSDAEYALGMAYRFGRGVRQDQKEGFAWLLRAAIKENPEAQFSVGYCYSHGEGVERNVGKALAWYRKAAKAGIADAAHNLSVLKKKAAQVTR